MNSILLTNGQLRKTLSVVRSLGSRGIHIAVGETTKLTPSGFSKYCSKKLRYPDPRREPERFYNWLLQALQKKQWNILLPMDDDVLAIVMEHRQEFEQYCYLPLPPTESYRIAADKGETAQLAMDLGIPVPLTKLPIHLEEIPLLAESIGYPIVIKPRWSSGSRGIRIVHHREQLVEEYGRIHENFRFPVLQEYIEPGVRFDVCLLFDRQGKLKASFVQKEIRHFPLQMGPSTVQESVHAPELIELALKLLNPLSWYGIVEVEFMIDGRDGKPKLMEINPRFWNSLHLAVLSGVDFPWLLYRLVAGEDFNEVVEYQVGRRCQWLLPGDLLHFLTNPQRMAMDPPLWAGKKHATKDDILSWQDPLPTVGFGLACLRYLLDWKAWRFVFKR